MSCRADDRFAAELLGTHVLAGIANVDRAGNVVARRQFHGRVVRASTSDGVTVVDAQGREHWLPLDREAYEPAEPGEYELRSTGEVVIDPTWLTRWTIYPPNLH